MNEIRAVVSFGEERIANPQTANRIGELLERLSQEEGIEVTLSDSLAPQEKSVYAVPNRHEEGQPWSYPRRMP